AGLSSSELEQQRADVRPGDVVTLADRLQAQSLFAQPGHVGNVLGAEATVRSQAGQLRYFGLGFGAQSFGTLPRFQRFDGMLEHERSSGVDRERRRQRSRSETYSCSSSAR